MTRLKSNERSMPLRVLELLFIICFSLVAVTPLLWLLANSIKSNPGFLNAPMGFPHELRLSNYAQAWKIGRIERYFLNSIIVTGGSVTILIVVCLPAAFALIRMQFRLRQLVLTLFLFGLFVPVHAIIVPVFITLNAMKLRGSLLALVLPYIAFGVPITTLIASGRLSTIPRELEEAAVMDGCGIFSVFFRIIVPLMRAEVVTVGIVNVIWIWNELFFALVVTSSDELRTLPFGLLSFVSQYATQWTWLFAGLVMSFLPLFGLYLGLQKYIIGGMTAGVIKG